MSSLARLLEATSGTIPALPTINPAAALSSEVLAATTALNPITGTSPTTAINALGSVAEAAKQAASGVLTNSAASAASTLASGLSNLPGGAGAAGALVNNATSALGAAANKLGAAAGALGSATTGLSDLANGIKDKATAAINNLKPPALDPAAALSKSGLPSGIASQLAAQISAIGSGGSVPISMPTIAVNTTNRGEITEQLSALLGEGIPKPNMLGEVKESTVSSFESYQKDRTTKIQEVGAAASASSDAFYKASKLQSAFEKAKRTLPQGDPKIQSAYDAYMAASVDYDNKWTAYKDLKKKYGLA